MSFFAKDEKSNTSTVVMTLLGKNLEYLLKKTKTHKFCLPTVVKFAVQAL